MFVAKRSGIGRLIGHKLENGNNMHLAPSSRESTLKVVKEKSILRLYQNAAV